MPLIEADCPPLRLRRRTLSHLGYRAAERDNAVTRCRSNCGSMHRAGGRNDVYARMRTIAAQLTAQEIDGLAAYYRAGFRLEPGRRRDLVRTVGLEPTRGFPQGILSPLRLPFRHVRAARF
jgi:hypothetical protein